MSSVNVSHVSSIIEGKTAHFMLSLNYFSGPNLYDDDDGDDDDSTNTPAPMNNVGAPDRKPKSAQQVRKS